MSAEDGVLTGPPAIAGGSRAFDEELRLGKPWTPDLDSLTPSFKAIFASGFLSNSTYVEELERKTAEYLQVSHCVAVSSCTAGLMLVNRALGRAGGEVLLPSFTFGASAHSVAWNRLTPKFVDIDPRSLHIDPSDVERALTQETVAILATHLYGAPCAIDELNTIARSAGIKLIFDAAHAFGSLYDGRRVGPFGDAEVFSLSPTKLLVAGEGGLITTNDDDLAENCRAGRNYGNRGNYNCKFVGLNARLSEIHAAIALLSLETLEERVQQRARYAEIYRGGLGDIPGISFPAVRATDRSTYKDFTIIVDPGTFGWDVPGLEKALEADGIETRRYYYPPIHTMDAYVGRVEERALPVTNSISPRVLTLPMWDDIGEERVERVADTIRRIQAAAG